MIRTTAIVMYTAWREKCLIFCSSATTSACRYTKAASMSAISPKNSMRTPEEEDYRAVTVTGILTADVASGAAKVRDSPMHKGTPTFVSASFRGGAHGANAHLSGMHIDTSVDTVELSEALFVDAIMEHVPWPWVGVPHVSESSLQLRLPGIQSFKKGLNMIKLKASAVWYPTGHKSGLVASFHAYSGPHDHDERGRVVLDDAKDSFMCRNVFARVDIYAPENDGGHDIGDYPWSATIVAAGVAFGRSANTEESQDTWTMSATRAEGASKEKVFWSLQKGKVDKSADLSMSAPNYMSLFVHPAAKKDTVSCGSDDKKVLDTTRPVPVYGVMHVYSAGMVLDPIEGSGDWPIPADATSLALWGTTRCVASKASYSLEGVTAKWHIKHGLVLRDVGVTAEVTPGVSEKNNIVGKIVGVVDGETVYALGVPAAFEWAVASMGFWVSAENYEMIDTTALSLSGSMAMKLGDYATLQTEVITGIPMPCEPGTRVNTTGKLASTLPFLRVNADVDISLVCGKPGELNSAAKGKSSVRVEALMQGLDLQYKGKDALMGFMQGKLKSVIPSIAAVNMSFVQTDSGWHVENTMMMSNNREIEPDVVSPLDLGVSIMYSTETGEVPPGDATIGVYAKFESKVANMSIAGKSDMGQCRGDTGFSLAGDLNVDFGASILGKLFRPFKAGLSIHQSCEDEEGNTMYTARGTIDHWAVFYPYLTMTSGSVDLTMVKHWSRSSYSQLNGTIAGVLDFTNDRRGEYAGPFPSVLQRKEGDPEFNASINASLSFTHDGSIFDVTAM